MCSVPVDSDIQRQRNLVERFVNELKHFRKTATRHEKPVRTHLAGVASLGVVNRGG